MALLNKFRDNPSQTFECESVGEKNNLLYRIWVKRKKANFGRNELLHTVQYSRLQVN